MKPKRVKRNGQWVETTNIGEPQTFPGVVKEAALAMNLSYASTSEKDDDGNEISVFIWVSGDWKVNYKGKEYIIPMSDNVNALIEWINGQEDND